jgi:hypothetical protein
MYQGFAPFATTQQNKYCVVTFIFWHKTRLRKFQGNLQALAEQEGKEY